MGEGTVEEELMYSSSSSCCCCRCRVRGEILFFVIDEGLLLVGIIEELLPTPDDEIL